MSVWPRILDRGNNKKSSNDRFHDTCRLNTRALHDRRASKLYGGFGLGKSPIYVCANKIKRLLSYHINKDHPKTWFLYYRRLCDNKPKG